MFGSLHIGCLFSVDLSFWHGCLTACCICWHICLSVFLFLSECPPLCPSTCGLICNHVCPSICLCVCPLSSFSSSPFVFCHLSFCIHTHLFVFLLVFVPGCLVAWLSPYHTVLAVHLSVSQLRHWSTSLQFCLLSSCPVCLSICVCLLKSVICLSVAHSLTVSSACLYIGVLLSVCLLT